MRIAATAFIKCVLAAVMNTIPTGITDAQAAAQKWLIHLETRPLSVDSAALAALADSVVSAGLAALVTLTTSADSADSRDLAFSHSSHSSHLGDFVGSKR
jgi:hypothetical protein